MIFFLRGKNYIVLDLALYYYKNFLEVEFFFNQELTIIIGGSSLVSDGEWKFCSENYTNIQYNWLGL